MMNTPIEILEMSFPLRVEGYALVPDSGGAGRWRGGLGTRRVWRVLGPETHEGAHASVCCERTVTPPFGLAEGRARRRARCGCGSNCPQGGREAAQLEGGVPGAAGRPGGHGGAGVGRPTVPLGARSELPSPTMSRMVMSAPRRRGATIATAVRCSFRKSAIERLAAPR